MQPEIGILLTEDERQTRRQKPGDDEPGVIDADGDAEYGAEEKAAAKHREQLSVISPQFSEARER